MSATILIADDDLTIRTVLGKALTRQGFKVRTTAYAATLWDWASQGEGDLIITDVMMPDGDGLELVPSLQRLRSDVKIIVISAQNSLSTAVKTQKLGVFAYLPKPFDLKELIGLVDSALGKTDMPQKASFDSLGKNKGADDFPLLGSAVSIQSLFRKMGKLSTSVEPVMVFGASGSGKTLAARTLAKSSTDKQIVEIQTANFDQALEQVDPNETGVLLVENVETLGLSQQQKLLTYLDGLDDQQSSRLISTAGTKLNELLKTDAFLRSLYDRLAVVDLQLPTLNSRLEDVPQLIEHFLQQHKSALVVAPEVLDFLKQQDWPGNVRQLENVVRRLVAYADDSQLNLNLVQDAFKLEVAIDPSSLFSGNDIGDLIARWVEHQLDGSEAESGLHKQLLDLVEKPLIEQILSKTRNNQIKTAAFLGLNRNTLRKKIRELGVSTDIAKPK